MLKNYKQEEKLKEKFKRNGCVNPVEFEKYLTLENKHVVRDCSIPFNFIFGFIAGVIITL